MYPILSPQKFPIQLTRRAVLLSALVVATAFLGGCFFGSLKFSATSTTTLSAPGDATSLVIHNRVGDVIVKADPNATGITAEIQMTGKGTTQEEADNALAEMTISFAPNSANASEIVGAVTHPKDRSRRGYDVRWIITAPPSVALNIQNDVGDVTAEGFTAPAKLKTDVGNVTAAAFQGDINAQADVGNVSADSAGAITLRTDIGDVVAVARGESHSISLSCDIGDVKLQLSDRWTGRIRAISDLGSVSLSDSFTNVRNMKQAKKSIEADIGDSGTAVAELACDIGGISIRTTPGAAAAQPSEPATDADSDDNHDWTREAQ